jgi:Fic family protein
MATKFEETDRLMERCRAAFKKHPEHMEEFQERLDFSWIYHDNALEGVVLSYHELKAAIDKNIISDVSLIPSYTDIRNHKEAIDLVRDAGGKKRVTMDLDFIKKIHLILNTGEVLPRNSRSTRNPGQYRKDNPLHRLYFHEIAPPEKISYRMRKLVEWLGSDEARKMHPIKRAGKAHYRLIGIFPWPRHSGKVARLLMNAILMHEGYLPAVIHAIERQRYYDVLRSPHSGLTTLICESIQGTVDAAMRFLQEVSPESVAAAS